VRPLLSFTEQRDLIIRAQSGRLSKDEIASMDLMPSDQQMIESFLPREYRWGAPASTPDQLRRIAADIQTRRRGQEFTDPIGFLLDGDEDAVRRLIDDENDWREVERERSKHQHNHQRKDGRHDDTSKEN